MSVNSKMTAIANAIRAKRGISGTLSLDQMAEEIGNIQTGITPSGTKTITANGTYDVTQFASADVAVQNGTHNRHYEVTNPTSVSGTGSYVVIASESILATVRSYDSLFIRILGAGESNCTKLSVSANTLDSSIIYATGYFQYVKRLNEPGSRSQNGCANRIDDDSNLSAGSGRIFITETGELRWYGNTNGYPILAGKIIADVLWEDA